MMPKPARCARDQHDPAAEGEAIQTAIGAMNADAGLWPLGLERME